MKTLKNILKIILIAVVWIAVWEMVYLIVEKEIILPSPLAVFLRLTMLAQSMDFWINIGGSILRIITGYLCAVVTGIIIGVLTSLVKILDHLLSPIACIIRATPVASFIILLFVFVAKNNVPAVTAFLMVLPVVWANVYQGVKRTDRKLLEMARVFELPMSIVLRKVYVPSVLPFFMAAAKTGMGLAWKAGIAAEVLVNPQYGIGSALHDSKIYLETTDLFAWTAIVIIISVILEKVLVRLAEKAYIHCMR